MTEVLSAITNNEQLDLDAERLAFIERNEALAGRVAAAALAETIDYTPPHSATEFTD